VIDEASDRERGHVRGIADFLELRRLTAGAYASFFSVELGLDIPDEVMAHPALESLLSLAADSTVLTNVRTLVYPPASDAVVPLTLTRIYTRLTMSKLRDTVAITSSRSS